MAEKILLKKYANRRLYDTEKNAYITLGQVADLIKEGRQVVVFNTTGGTKDEYETSGNRTCIEHLASDGIFRFCGMRVARHVFMYAVPFVKDADRKLMLESVRDFAGKLTAGSAKIGF